MGRTGSIVVNVVLIALLVGAAHGAAPPPLVKITLATTRGDAMKAGNKVSGYRPVSATTPVYAVAFSPDGKWLAVGGYKYVALYDAETGKQVARYIVGKDAVRTVAFSPDGKRIAAGGGVPAAGGTIAVIDAATGKLARTLSDHADTVESVAFSGDLLLSAADDETVTISSLTTGKTIGTLREHVGRCLSVVVPSRTSDADGGNIFVTSGSDNMVKVWDADKRRVVVNFDQATGPVWSVAAFARPGRFLAGSADGHLRWDNVYTERERQLPDGKKVPIVPQPGEPQPRGSYVERDIMAHEGGVYAVATSATDQFFVSGGADNKVIQWNPGGVKLREWADATKDIWGVAVSPDGKRIASASLDGHVRVYDAEKGLTMWTFPAIIVPSLPARAGLAASYYANRDLSGPATVRRLDALIDFDYATNPPAPGVGREDFSVRWEGYYAAPVAGAYLFATRADDGTRLWLDNKLVIDDWLPHATTQVVTKEPIPLKAGQRVPIKLEYFQGNGGAEVHLLAGVVGQPLSVVPKTALSSGSIPMSPSFPVSKPVPKPPATAAKPTPVVPAAKAKPSVTTG